MKIKEPGGFSLSDTLESGQCFRYKKDGEWFLVEHGCRKAKVKQADGQLDFECCKADEAFWLDFFHLGFDYGKVRRSLSEDKVICCALDRCGGIHILKQDVWEALISFIISQNNNIPRIKKIISLLCENFGDGGFPSPAQLACLSPEDLAPIKAGFRAKYIIDAAQKVQSGEVKLNELHGMSYEDAAAELKKIKGVGDKVAACVLLFGAQFYDAFPVDVWIKKAVEVLYPEGFEKSRFKGYAGIAQQYLYHYARVTGLKF